MEDFCLPPEPPGIATHDQILSEYEHGSQEIALSWLDDRRAWIRRCEDDHFATLTGAPLQNAPKLTLTAAPEPQPQAPERSAPLKAKPAPNADAMTMLCATVWDNWLGEHKPKAPEGRRISMARYSVTVECWDRDPRTIRNIAELTATKAWRGSTDLITHPNFLKLIPKLEQDGKISHEYAAELLHIAKSSAPTLRFGLLGASGSLLRAHTGKGYFPHQFITIEVLNGVVSYAKLHLNGEVIDLPSWSDENPDGAKLAQGKRRWPDGSVRSQCFASTRIDFTSTYGYVSWPT